MYLSTLDSVSSLSDGTNPLHEKENRDEVSFFIPILDSTAYLNYERSQLRDRVRLACRPGWSGVPRSL